MYTSSGSTGCAKFLQSWKGVHGMKEMEEVAPCPNPKPHFVVIPFSFTSHIIPIVDIGCLLAAHGAPVTIITTPGSSELVQSRVDRARAGAASAAGTITVTALPFPGADAGLPAGCERLDHVPSVDLVPNFFDANEQFGAAVARHYRRLTATTHRRRPSCCIVAGMCNTWARHGVARELGGAPCFIFHGFGAFALQCCEYLNTRRPHEAAASPDEAFDVPVLPPFELRFSRAQLPLQFLPSCSIPASRLRELREFETAVDGIVVNSFEELEHGSAARLAAATGKTVLAVGPVSLSLRGGGGARARAPPPSSSLLGFRATSSSDDDDARRCMTWLDAKKASSSSSSVLYVSFGSAGRLPPAQLMQLGQALVSCSWPVLWVIKGADTLPDDVSEWLRRNTDDGDGGGGLPAAESQSRSKCLVVRGWAPQVAILEHPAVGGFLTHCGWGSTLESVAAGVAMATWPFSAEQFLNEKLIVDVLGVGVSVGVTKPTVGVLTGGEATAKKADVGMEQVKRALDLLMDAGVDGEVRRTKARELKVKAKSALEHGGSSYMNLEKLIQFAA